MPPTTQATDPATGSFSETSAVTRNEPSCRRSTTGAEMRGVPRLTGTAAPRTANAAVSATELYSAWIQSAEAVPFRMRISSMSPWKQFLFPSKNPPKAQTDFPGSRMFRAEVVEKISAPLK